MLLNKTQKNFYLNYKKQSNSNLTMKTIYTINSNCNKKYNFKLINLCKIMIKSYIQLKIK